MYDPNVGRWLSEDPIGFEAGDANVYRYVGNFSTGAVDPSGLVVNSLNTTTIETFVNRVRKLEALEKNKDATWEDILDQVWENIDSGNWTWYYIYTTKYGWIDMGHFINSARWGCDAGSIPTIGLGNLLEGLQVIQRFAGMDDGHSALNREDFPSNIAGAHFGDVYGRVGRYYNKSELKKFKLSGMLEAYFRSMGATDPRKAPDFKTLPVTEHDVLERYRDNLRKCREMTNNAIQER